MRMANNNNITTIRIWVTGNLIQNIWECKIILWKTMEYFFIKLNIYFPYDPEIPLIGIRLVENKKPVLQIFIAPLLLLLKAGNNTNIPQGMNGSTNWGHHAMEYYSATKNQTTGTQDNMNRSPVHYSKYIMGRIRLKRLQTAWFHLYDILEKVNNRKIKYISNFQELEVGKRIDSKWGDFLRWWNCLIIWVVVRIPCVCQGSQNCTLRRNFTICKW